MRLLGYLWAAPATCFGLVLVALTKFTGGSVKVFRGVIEAQGGATGGILRRGLPFVGPTSAITIGHVIIGRDREALELSRDHEHVHVRQFERWGVFLLPAYLSASVVQWARGLDPYWDNPFERQARAGETTQHG